MTYIIAITILIVLAVALGAVNHSLEHELSRLERQSESLAILAKRLQSENNRLMDRETERVHNNNPKRKGTPQ